MKEIEYHIPTGSYLAMDKDGRWFAYNEMPEIDREVSKDKFVCNGEKVDLADLVQNDWENSIIKIVGKK